MYRLSESWIIGETSENGGEESPNCGFGEFRGKKIVCLNSPVTPKHINGGCFTYTIEEDSAMAKIIQFPILDESIERQVLTIGRHHYRIRPRSLMASVWRWVEELWEV